MSQTQKSSESLPPKFLLVAPFYNYAVHWIVKHGVNPHRVIIVVPPVAPKLQGLHKVRFVLLGEPADYKSHDWYMIKDRLYTLPNEDLQLSEKELEYYKSE